VLAQMLLLSLAVAGGAVAQRITGIGFALTALPAFALVAADTLPVALLLLAIPLTAVTVAQRRHLVRVRDVVLIAPVRALAALATVPLATRLDDRYTAVAASLAAAICAGLLHRPARTAPTRHGLRTAGALSGVLDALAGIGGPPLARAYAGHEGPATTATLSLLALIGAGVALAGHVTAHGIDPHAAATASTCLPALVVGALAGHRLAAVLRPRPIRLITTAIILIGAVTVIAVKCL
jgi:uncharacterized protein